MKNILEKLSKSSPYAVATDNDKDIFKYLHIKTDIEKEYLETLKDLKEKRIIFLCGSSGDGKSAIITRTQNQFNDRYKFHLDATHSFSPNETALERLDKVFEAYIQGDKSLVIGINMGILINYSKYNRDKNSKIKKSIQAYLNSPQKEVEESIFINFEDYPKFENIEERITSKFLKNIFQKVTSDSFENPFYQAYLKGKEHRTLLCDNFEFLARESVQDRIIELIVLSYLKYNQFLTARAILDFIYTLLSDNKLLSDTLFENTTNSIIKNISQEDPCLRRSESIDSFLLKQANQEENKLLNVFLQDLNLIDKNLNPCSLLRVFYLLNSDSISNDYHKEFFQESNLVEEYIRLLIAHNRGEDNSEVKVFYKKIKKALFSYINRNRLKDKTNELIILESDDAFISVEVDIKRDKNMIKKGDSKKIKSFECYLLANDKRIKPIEITFNIYKMIEDINNGYRPNRYDKNSLIIFHEFMERIVDEVKTSNKLIVTDKEKRYIFTEIDEDEIEVE
jgi:DNA phosphorothioation-dependent restriction protein DptF